MNKPKKESERFLWQLVNDTEKTNMWKNPWLGLEELVQNTQINLKTQ